MSFSSSHPDYAGDLSPSEAWDLLKHDTAAQLVDVRTMAEWNFVGLPDLGPLGRQVHCVEWQSFPTGQTNSDFVAEAAAALKNAAADTPILFLCRSGGRSRAAAMAMTAAGFSKAYNIAGGFEGDLDAQRHRGTGMSWKGQDLPWRQS